MRCWKSILAVVACLMGTAPASCRAGFVVTAGTEKVIPGNFPLVAPNATWTGVLATIAGETVGTKDNLATGTADGAPTSNTTLTIRTPADFAGRYDAAKLGPIPKFLMNPVRGSRGFAFMNVTAGKNPNTTTAQAESSFDSDDDEILGPLAFLEGSAQVTRATGKSPAGIAFASSEDPWSFTPDTSSELQLTIGLEDISLVVSASNGESAIGMIHAFGSFGVDSTAGFQVLASWDFLKEVSGNDSFSLSSLTLVDQISGKPLNGEMFQLSPGVTYQLNADLLLGARVDPVPEPAAAALLGIGAFGLLGYSWGRCKKAPLPAFTETILAIGGFGAGQRPATR